MTAIGPLRPAARRSVSFLFVPAVAFVAAAAPAVPVTVRVELIESSLEQPQVTRCEVASDIEKRSSAAWTFFYGEVQRGESGSWEVVRTRTGCESGEFEEALRSSRWRGVPYLVVDVSARRRSTKDHVEQLDVSISQRKLSGFGPTGEPSYARSAETRALSVKAGVPAAVPLLIADQKERDAFRIHDVLLRFRASTPGKMPAAYGRVSVHSDTPRADILLDGGVVARTVEGTQTLLKNVLAGERELRVRDFSGREAREVVRVPTSKNLEVTLNLRTPSRPALDNGLVPLGTNPQGHEEYWRRKDGAPVVKVPAGEFLMGSVAGEGEPNEHPQRKVYVSSYIIDKTEVTWGQYAKFAAATGKPLPEAPLWGMPDDYPATPVIWPEAAAFCGWVGGRLPTEAEWEKAARGSDGRRYPWGDDWDPDRCNTRDGGPHRPEGVGAFPGCISPYGVLDMCGGVWEYCLDWYDEKYYETGPTRDPRGPGSGRGRVLRGGSWLEPSTSTRSALRLSTEPSWRNTRHGFRCVQDVPDKAR